MTAFTVKGERLSQHHTSEGAGGAGVTVLASLFSSPIFWGWRWLSKKEAWLPRHARQGFQEEELGESCRGCGRLVSRGGSAAPREGRMPIS